MNYIHSFICITFVLFLPNVEKSKSSGFSDNSPVFSKKAFNSFLDLNRLPEGPMMNTSYLPAEAPLFRWDTFLCQPWGSVSSSINGVLLGSVGCRLRCTDLGEDLGGVTVVMVADCGCWTGSGIVLVLVLVLTIVGVLIASLAELGAVWRIYWPSGP